jgi:hypothetical protein
MDERKDNKINYIYIRLYMEEISFKTVAVNYLSEIWRFHISEYCDYVLMGH